MNHTTDQHLAALVQEYRDNPDGCYLTCEQDFESAVDLNHAIKIAVRSIDIRGKRHSHQRRIPECVLEALEGRLFKHVDRLNACNNFDALHDIVVEQTNQITGAGPLLAYDVALRIGTNFLNLLPERVYLHAGARIGAKKLGVRSHICLLTDLPAPLHVLKPKEAEDFLCIFKHRF